MVFSNNLLMGAAGQGGGGYEIENSVRLDGVADMSRTVASDGNLRTWSWSFWVKRSGLGTNGGLGFNIGGTYQSGTTRSTVRFYSSGNGTDDFYWFEYVGGVFKEDQWTDAQYRDPSAWYHILLVWDTDGGTTPRARRYINGIQVTELGSSPAAAANADSATNKSGTFQLFDQPGFAGREFEGYCAEMHFVDGTALEPTDFGNFNDDGVWIPIKTSGITYGSNGFYLDFADSSDLGKDVSGNSNDFTSSGLATTDQMLDTPTLNYCTLSPIDGYGGKLTLSDGNLRAVPAAAAYCNNHGTFYVNSGKWVFEVKHTTVFGEACGWSPMGERIAGSSNRGYFMFADGRAYINVSNQGTKGASLSSGDYRYIFYDADLEAMWFAHVDVSSSNALVYDNSATKAEIEAGTTTNAVFTSIQDVDFAPGIWMDTSGVIEVNFGQSAFITSSALPTGFNTLNTVNLATPSIKDGSAYMQTLAYASTGTSTAFVQDGNSQFEPGLVWEKSRTGANNHLWFDQVRGATKFIRSDTTNAENTVADTLTSFNSNGFTAGADSVNWGINYPGRNNVAWMWKANGTGSSNTDGSITSTVSANTTAGFSISKYTGTGANATVGHGLGVAPQMIIIKNLADADSWVVYHEDVGATKGLTLDTTAASTTASTFFNNTAPTSSVFSVGGGGRTNGSSDAMIAYCFAEIPGYSSFGSYTGNGSTDGPFIYTGFAPEFIMVKSSSNSGTNWDMLDATRETFNTRGNQLFANSNAVEASNDHECDFLSNGFKWRDGSGSNNGSGYTIIYMAFAKHPFGGDGVAPATAR
jgi:hypothetical protein